MTRDPQGRYDLTRIAQQLGGDGYVVLEGLLDSDQLTEWRSHIDSLAVQERQAPFLPGDGPVHPGDEEIESYLAESYAVSREELARMMQRVRHTRAENRDTPWPVGPREINKTFMHIPNLFDQDRSQYVRNLPAKTHLADGLVEHPVVLGLAHRLLGRDCVLGDVTRDQYRSGHAGRALASGQPLDSNARTAARFPPGVSGGLDDRSLYRGQRGHPDCSPQPLDPQQAQAGNGATGPRRRLCAEMRARLRSGWPAPGTG